MTSTPQITFSYTVGAYRIRVAESAEDIASSLRLRSQVFLGEFAATPPSGAEALDQDEYDADCDHLVISRADDPAVIASYRLRLHTPMSTKCYTNGEFDLDDFLLSPGRKLELGRACVSPDHRNGTVLRLLWRGIYEYALRAEADVFFGCSSLTASEISSWQGLLAVARETDSLLPLGQFRARPHYEAGAFPEVLRTLNQAPDLPGRVTTLLTLYLLAGAKISESLAYDAAFGCVDIFTLLRLSDLPPAFRRPLSREGR